MQISFDSVYYVAVPLPRVVPSARLEANVTRYFVSLAVYITAKLF